jgi:cbb3-type cytochrome oxidase cytochrome c subunit
MNYGPLVFLAAFFALASSWCGFILTPQLQIGRLQETNTLGNASSIYPAAPPGLAHEGLEVYRANGCEYCHSQQVGQTGTALQVALTDAGTNHTATLTALLDLAKSSTAESTFLKPLPLLEPGQSAAASAALFQGLPKAFLQSSTRQPADAAIKTLDSVGAKAQLWIVPEGPDIARGWGKRHSVAQDYLFDSPAMPGAQRIGPDLSNVGVRLPDVNWHLLHLYAPQLVVKGSIMPSYRFLCEQRKIKRHPSADALALPGDLAPPPGYEIVPRHAAKALAAYLVSLRSEAPLFAAPMTVAAAPATPGATNAPAATNAAPANPSAK